MFSKLFRERFERLFPNRKVYVAAKKTRASLRKQTIDTQVFTNNSKSARKSHSNFRTDEKAQKGCETPVYNLFTISFYALTY